MIEPAIKRVIGFVDGQNVFYAAKKAFGYSYPKWRGVTTTEKAALTPRRRRHERDAAGSVHPLVRDDVGAPEAHRTPRLIEPPQRCCLYCGTDRHERCGHGFEVRPGGDDVARPGSVPTGNGPALQRPDIVQGSARELERLVTRGVQLRDAISEIVLEPVRDGVREDGARHPGCRGREPHLGTVIRLRRHVVRASWRAVRR